MIETHYSFNTTDETTIEKIVENFGVRINKLTLAGNQSAPVHPTSEDAHMIVTSGTLSIALDAQEPHDYHEGSIIGIPAGTMMSIHNNHETTLHVFVIKRQ
ncbi:MAG: cupin domain-containing protein [Sphaerochaetaceae bacterium]|nr:cupin domain-containing protein [Sphaerochaetaceae bacterium]